jgi:nucleoside-diphosphate-sugar epimerase
MAIKLIITGATGFVGEGVLLECLENPHVSEVLLVNRRHSECKHPKIKELVIADFFLTEEYSNSLKGYDACFYCAGISSAGMNEKDYSYITYDTTIAFARSLLRLNEGITFCFISGSHTDSSENGKIMWARVKGRTENDLMKMPFKKEYNFRPGGMIPTAGQKNAKMMYRFIVKLISVVAPKRISTLKEVGQSMINATVKGYPKQILEIQDIKQLANN